MNDKTPKGDGNCREVSHLRTKQRVMNDKTPKGDGNMKQFYFSVVSRESYE